MLLNYRIVFGNPEGWPFASNQLTGSLPAAWSSLTAMQTM
jgi:hypothetical protein